MDIFGQKPAVLLDLNALCGGRGFSYAKAMNSVFQCQRRVIYSECAPGDHVYYGRYLDYLEYGRGEFFRELGSSFLSWQQQNTAFPVTACELSFKFPARYDDLLTIETWLLEVGRVRLKFAYRIHNAAGKELVRGTTTHACTSTLEKIQPIPDLLKKLLLPFLHTAPEAKEP
jgi:acyl-CoA thioester hydrolase